MKDVVRKPLRKCAFTPEKPKRKGSVPQTPLSDDTPLKKCNLESASCSTAECFQAVSTQLEPFLLSSPHSRS